MKKKKFILFQDFVQPIARKLSLFIGQTEDRKLPDILTQSLQDFRFFRNRRWTEPKNKKKCILFQD